MWILIVVVALCLQETVHWAGKSLRSRLLTQITLSSHCNRVSCLDSRAYLTCPSYPYCYRSGRLGLPHLPTAHEGLHASYFGGRTDLYVFGGREHWRFLQMRGWDLVRWISPNPLRNTCRAFVFCNVQKRSLRAGIGVIWRLVFGCWLCGILKLSLSTLCSYTT